MVSTTTDAASTTEESESGGGSSAKEPTISQPSTPRPSFPSTNASQATITPNGIKANGSYRNDNMKHDPPHRKSSAPFPNTPEATDWSTPADLAHVRANTPLAPAPPPVISSTHEIKPTPKPVRSKSDASQRSIGAMPVFKRMFGGGGGHGNALDAGMDKLALGGGSVGLGSGVNSPAAMDRTDPMNDIGARKGASRSASTDGKDRGDHHGHHGPGQRFNLTDLLSSGPKLARKSSASSRRSDSSSAAGEAVNGQGYTSGPDSIPRGGGSRSRGPSSVGGDSATSLSKKYGVCERGPIGKGATSVVRLAHKWDRKEEKLYAVKEFRKRRKNETEKEYTKKLTAEFCISSTLHHPNVVETVDLVQDEQKNWCEVMEYCPGGDLYAAIKHGQMSPSEVECSFKQILQGVGYLHSQGVAHRDLKPENIFFDAKGQLKIGDYGASTVYRLPWETSVHMSTGLCGSEPYIAPEQFENKPYDARLVDIWACGIVYYCLHFQELPWRVAQPSDNLYMAYLNSTQSRNAQEAECPATIHNLCPRQCRPLLRKMLEPIPSRRILIEEVLKDSWMASIEVCTNAEKPGHIHVHARKLTSGGSV